MLIGMVSTGFAVGGMLVALLGIFVIPNLGWQWMFFLGGIPILTVPLLIKYLPESLDFLVIKGEDRKSKSNARTGKSYLYFQTRMTNLKCINQQKV